MQVPEDGAAVEHATVSRRVIMWMNVVGRSVEDRTERVVARDAQNPKHMAGATLQNSEPEARTRAAPSASVSFQKVSAGMSCSTVISGFSLTSCPRIEA